MGTATEGEFFRHDYLNSLADDSIQANALTPIREIPLRSGNPIQVVRREFASQSLAGRERFVEDMRTCLAPLQKVEVADFEIYDCTPAAGSSLTLDAKIRYDFVGMREHPAGLPNRLYRNRGDGTFEDVTEQSGVGLLDFTACALFADFDNRGRQDLV